MKKAALILFILLMVLVPSVFSARWIKDKVYLETDDVGKVEFSHDTHLEMESIGRNCPTCHNDVYHLDSDKNPAFTMAEMEDGEACGVCHNDEMAFSVTENCTVCHAGDVAMQTENVGSVPFSHDIHLDMFGCDECHPDLFLPESGPDTVTMAAMKQGESCGACHDGDMAFSVSARCSSCHAGDLIFKEEDAGDAIFPHSTHNAMFGCDDCHPDLYQAARGANPAVTMAEMEDGESCGACHDGDMAFGVAEDCESCHAM